MAQIKTLRTTSQIIDALGGTTEVGILTGRDFSQVARWRKIGRLPPGVFLVMIQALRARGYDAPVELWGQRAYAGAV